MPNCVPALKVQICEEIAQVEPIIETKCILCIGNLHSFGTDLAICAEVQGCVVTRAGAGIEVGDSARGGLNPRITVPVTDLHLNGGPSGVLVRSRGLQ